MMTDINTSTAAMKMITALYHRGLINHETYQQILYHYS